MYDDVMAERMPTLWARLRADEAAREARAAAGTAPVDARAQPSSKQ
jgi:hypothetical protein